MPPKKRKLSPTASSSSSLSATPTSLPIPQFPTSPSSSTEPSNRLSESVTPAPLLSGSQGLSLAQTNGGALSKDERTTARPGTIVPGSGDGAGCGDECYLWADLPMNKNGYRYLPCGPSPNPSPSPHHPFYRPIPFSAPTPPVHISWLDRSHFLRLSPDALTATTDRGFRSGRANIPVREGKWYYEVQILRGAGGDGAEEGSGKEGGNAHIRVGWGRREAGLDAPVGADGYAYGIRDVGGDKVHFSRLREYGKRGFGTGDVVGCLIYLPSRQELDQGDDDDARKEGGEGRNKVERKRISIRYKGQNYFEMDDYPPQKEMDVLVDREGKLDRARIEAELTGNADLPTHANGTVGDHGSVSTTVQPPQPKGKRTKNTKNPKNGKTDTSPSLPTSRELKRIKGSYIEFYINGQSLGPKAFTDLYDYLPLPPLPTLTLKKGHHHGHGPHSHPPEKDFLRDDGTLGYYPMISTFGRGKVKLNFGPDFHHPPPVADGQEASRAMSERWTEYAEEERVLDERDEKELIEKLEKEIEAEKIRRAAVEARMAKKPGISGKKGGVGSPLSGKERKGSGTPISGGSKLASSSSGIGATRIGLEESRNGLTPESSPAPDPQSFGTAQESSESVKREIQGTPASPAPEISDRGTPASVRSGSGSVKRGTKGKRGRGRGGRSTSRASSSVSAGLQREDLGGEADAEGEAVEDVEMMKAEASEGEEEAIKWE